MLLRLLTAISLIALAFMPTAASADERVGAFLIVDDASEVIGLVDAIDLNSPLDFRRAIQKRPHVKTLILASPGGLVPSALIIAQDVHQRGLATYIPPDTGCYSACSYIFLAGHERIVEGELGVHQMASDMPDDDAGIQVTISDLLDTLLEFDTPREVITRMLRTPNEDMYVFTPEEIESLGINRVADVSSQVNPSPPSAPSVPAHQPEVSRLAVYEGLDFYGADLSSGHTENLVECTRACLGDRLCRAITYNADPKIKTGPNCFLKTGIGELESYQFAISGLILDPDDTEVPEFEFGAIDPTTDVSQGVRIDGRSITGTKPFASLGECRKGCIADTQCVAFTYRSDRKQCVLKADIKVTTKMSGYTSGFKQSLSFAATDVIPLD